MKFGSFRQAKTFFGAGFKSSFQKKTASLMFLGSGLMFSSFLAKNSMLFMEDIPSQGQNQDKDKENQRERPKEILSFEIGTSESFKENQIHEVISFFLPSLEAFKFRLFSSRSLLLLSHFVIHFSRIQLIHSLVFTSK